MRNCFAGILVIFVLALMTAAQASPPSATPKKIKQVVEAGIEGCDSSAPDSIGPKFYSHVKKACAGRLSCGVRPTQVLPLKSLQKWKCTKFFVMISCGANDTQEYHADSLTEKLGVFCDGP